MAGAQRLERLDGGGEAGILGVEEAEVVEKQQAGVDPFAVEGGGEAASGLRVREDVPADGDGPVRPVRVAVGEAEDPCDARQPVAGGPAHDAREGVHRAPLPELPEAGVGLVEQACRLVAELLEPAEHAPVAGLDQPAVEEALGDGEDGAAVVVVLKLPPGVVAHAHRPHAAVAGQAVDGAFGELPLELDAVDRLQHAALGRRGEVRDVAEVALHRAGGAQAVERLDDEVGVPQPAEAVVPVAAAVRRFGDRSGHRREHGSGLLETAELERDRGPDHRLLPLEGDRQVAHELAPPGFCPAPELSRHGVHGLGQALVRPEQQGERLLQDEGDLVGDQRDRRVGGQPERQIRPDVADVVASTGQFGAARAVVEARSQADADAGFAGQAFDGANDHRRPEGATELLEPGGEVRDPDRGAVAVAERRHQDRRVL